MILALVKDDAAYRIFYLLHIASVVAAFSGAMVSARFGAVARGDASVGRSISSALSDLTVKMHIPALAAAGLFGIVMITLSDDLYEMSQTWISIAFTLWFAMLAVMWFLLRPAQIAAAGGDAEAGKKTAMFTGIIHLLFLLMLIDMIWKPGL